MLKRPFIYACLALILFITSSIGVVAAPPAADPLPAGRSVYKLWINNKATGEHFGSCTGFVAESTEGELRIVTNSHCCVAPVGEISSEVGFETSVTLEDGRKLEQGIFDKFADICTLSIIDGDSSGEQPLHLAKSPIADGEPIVVIGHPRGATQRAVIGTKLGEVLLPTEFIPQNEANAYGEGNSCVSIPMIENVCLYFRHSDTYRVEIYPGNSGSPVLNKYGEVVAIIWGTYILQKDLSLAASLEQLKKYIK